MRKYLILLPALLFSCFIAAQQDDLKKKIYSLEIRIIIGDTTALRELAIYIDNTTPVTEYFGWESFSTTPRKLALRIIGENCLLNVNELKTDTSLTSGKFSTILNSGRLKFDELTGMFLITPLTERRTKYILRELSVADLSSIDETKKSNDYPGRFYEMKVKDLLQTRNPEVLVWIASDRFRGRHSFNGWHFSDEQFLKLMKKLTHIDLGVWDRKNEITFLYEGDYYANAKLNYLIYWVNHYNDYRWNEQKGYFENIKERPGQKSEEEILFPLLRSENDSLAMDAFLRLSEMDTGRIKALAADYETGLQYGGNFKLPFYPYSFLRELTQLSTYCRSNGIIYKTNGWMLESLEKLKDWHLQYKERYDIENKIIDKLTPAIVTMVEYYGIINERDWSSGYSIGRILDKYYSKHWNEIISDESNLLLFLKKMNLFEHGISSKYFQKFKNCTEKFFEKINLIFNTTNDNDIKKSARKIMENYDPSLRKTEESIAAWNDGEQYGGFDLLSEYKSILVKYSNKESRVFPIQQLVARINYSQLGDAVKILIADNNWGQYDYPLWIVSNDFGLQIDPKSDSAVSEFFKVYNSKTEYELYEYYLNKKGLHCLNDNGDFIFEKVYDVLKFDVVSSFVNGSAASREDGVYLLIKLLELKFETRLGFCEKLCGSKGVYSCSCRDRARLWMKFLENKGLVAVDKNEPPSMSYYY